MLNKIWLLPGAILTLLFALIAVYVIKNLSPSPITQVSDKGSSVAKPEVKNEPKPEVKNEPMPEVKNEPMPEVKNEPKPEVKNEPKPEEKISEFLLAEGESIFVIFVNIGLQDKPMPNIVLTPQIQPSGKVKENIDKLPADFTTTVPLSNKARKAWFEKFVKFDKLTVSDPRRLLLGTYEVRFVANTKELKVVKLRNNLVIVLKQLREVLSSEDSGALGAINNLLVRLGEREGG